MNIESKEYKEMMKKATTQSKARDKRLNQKDYLITATTTGCEHMSFGKSERKVFPNQYYATVSLNEIEEYIGMMKRGFWEHPDLLDDKSNAEEIPHEEKKWGRYSNIVIEPLSEELEKSYLEASKEGFFKTHRQILQWEEGKEVA
jgi:hypothetical protein|tara:strand:+ start:54 stop:488 length:435 start_codon:yes stop_codon:yes gene_type:complete